MIEQIQELKDKSVSGFVIKALRDGDKIFLTCKSGNKTVHSYNLLIPEWRNIQDNGKLHFNRLVYLDKKVPQIIGVGISNLRSKIMDAEVRLIVRIVNEG